MLKSRAAIGCHGVNQRALDLRKVERQEAGRRNLLRTLQPKQEAAACLRVQPHIAQAGGWPLAGRIGATGQKVRRHARECRVNEREILKWRARRAQRDATRRKRRRDLGQQLLQRCIAPGNARQWVGRQRLNGWCGRLRGCHAPHCTRAHTRAQLPAAQAARHPLRRRLHCPARPVSFPISLEMVDWTP